MLSPFSNLAKSAGFLRQQHEHRPVFAIGHTKLNRLPAVALAVGATLDLLHHGRFDFSLGRNAEELFGGLGGVERPRKTPFEIDGARQHQVGLGIKPVGRNQIVNLVDGLVGGPSVDLFPRGIGLEKSSVSGSAS